MRMSFLQALVVLNTLTAPVGGASSGSIRPFKRITITAPDGSAKASFIRYGATTTNFWVKDKHGEFRDIILGFDDTTQYQTDALGHPYFGPVVGRYANRIKNGTFSIPISKNPPPSGHNVFHVPENENNGTDTLHGGTDGFDRRVWSVGVLNSHSVSFTLVDPDGTQGFPGTVHATVTYTLEPRSTWKITMHATATKKTPIMLSGHHYWNLEAYKESQDLLGHVSQFPASRVITTNGLLIPDGKLLDVSNTPLDFRKAKSIGESINSTAPFEFCGTGCVGFDNCWIYDKVQPRQPKMSMWSKQSGIKLDVFTDQPALQVYTCNGIFNAELPIPRKRAHGGPESVYENHSCVVIEQESWIDAINNPEFGVDQIHGPGRDYRWSSTYVFSRV
ncbi:galactose mutarotase-like protein [Cristinia sonorae]|uniref:Galactose mutarotase-like protein n=1 Tax=Cristinia sonorae TaxID=1940300 RepID=A0A8K0XTL4_9AGAR|nr:galactose mutarotase-like protein [Cristinia sonorae]